MFKISTLIAAVSFFQAPIDLHVLDHHGLVQAGPLFVDGREVCRIDPSNSRAPSEPSTCRFALRAASAIEFQEARAEFLDFGPVTRPLSESGDFGSRFERYMHALQRFRQQHGESDELIQREKPASATQLDAAEERLGYALPEEFRALLIRLGGTYIGRSRFFSGHRFSEVGSLENSHDFIIRNWSMPAEVMRTQLEPDVAALLKRTTVLFTEEGDGVGGVLYAPQEEACGGRPGYWWTHTDYINDLLLLRNARGDCASFAESVHWLLDEIVTNHVQDELPERTLLLDSTGPHHALILTGRPLGFEIRRIGPRAAHPGSQATAAF